MKEKISNILPEFCSEVRSAENEYDDGILKMENKYDTKRHICWNLPKIKSLDEMYGYQTVNRPGPRSLHFRGRRPIPRLPELASNCVRPAAAGRGHCRICGTCSMNCVSNAESAGATRCEGICHCSSGP